MRQAVTAVLQWAFRVDQVDRVHAFVRVDNKRSEGLLKTASLRCLAASRVPA